MSDPSANLKCYLVGGAVRDHLLGLPETDRDWVVVGHDASEMKRLGFRQVGAAKEIYKIVVFFNWFNVRCRLQMCAIEPGRYALSARDKVHNLLS